jgi:Flp pilus assembly protein TadB
VKRTALRRLGRAVLDITAETAKAVLALAVGGAGGIALVVLVRHQPLVVAVLGVLAAIGRIAWRVARRRRDRARAHADAAAWAEYRRRQG